MKDKINLNIKVIRELVRLRFQNLMMFRFGFFGPFFVDGSLFIVQLLVFSSVYNNVDVIGTWHKGEMILFIGTFSLINAINMFIFFFGINDIPEHIKSGTMDMYLTKPVSPLLRFTFEKINPGSFPLILFSLVIIGYGIISVDCVVTVQNILFYICWVILMTILWYDMEVIIRSIAFFVISGRHITAIEDACLPICMQIPGVVFYGIYKLIFCCLLPYGIMATIPVESLTGNLNLAGSLYGLGIVIVFSVLTAIIWKAGIRHYNSASS